MPITRLLAFLAALLAVAVAAPAGMAQVPGQPQCSDGIDNDLDNRIDGEDAGCGDGADDDEADSPYSGIQIVTRPFPVVTLQGTVLRKGTVKVKKLFIRADRGSRVQVACKGKSCPFKQRSQFMLTSRLELKAFKKRNLRPGTVLELRVGLNGQLGKYVRYTVRKRKTPKRFDSCYDGLSGAVQGCFKN